MIEGRQKIAVSSASLTVRSGARGIGGPSTCDVSGVRCYDVLA